MKVRHFNHCLYALIICLLVGCASRHVDHKKPKLNPFYYGELCSRSMQGHLVFRLQKAGVKVNFLGDHILIVIPAQLFFKNHSSHLQEGSRGLLKTIARLLSCYQKMSVEVVGYNNELANKRASKSLSSLQAQQVAHYLWKNNIDSRLIDAKGKGAITKYNESGNCRVEIYTKKLF